MISEQSTGFPGYNSIIGVDNATIGRILLDNGYNTSWFGKDHNTPAFQASQSGPFTQWPTGMGFEYFYGFVGGDANQWEPNLFRNTTQIYPFLGKPPGTWNLVTAMADEAIDWATRMHQIDPSKPIFIKYAPGATHAPHHPTKEWVDKISAMHLFDDGYEKLRERIFENQKKLGVIPKDAKLTPWPSDVLTPWDKLTPEAKKLYIRQVEVFAAYAAYGDAEIGRVVQAFQDLGKLDNTLVIYINGDNGTSAEGGPLGTPNEVAFFNGVIGAGGDADEMVRRLGHGAHLQPHVGRLVVGLRHAVRLVQAERLASGRHQPEHGGVVAGTYQGQGRAARAVRARHRRRADDPGGGRHQGARDGGRHQAKADRRHQLRLHLRSDERQGASRHKTQYFEMMGQWALYDDGWFLSTKVDRAPWEAFGAANADPLNNQVFQLYNLNTDFTQSEDLAAKYPQKVKEMRRKFVAEAKKYQVLPLDASVAARVVAPRPNITAGRTEFVYTRPMVGLPQGDSPLLLNTRYTITADIEVPQGGAEGMMLTSGGRFAGYGFYLLKGKPVFLWNLVDLERLKWEGAEALTPGRHTVEFDFKYEGMGVGTLVYNSFSGLGRPGTGTLKVDGKVVATKRMEKTLPIILQWDESFDVGSDTLTGVNDADYKPPFALTAKLNKLTIKLDRPQLSPADIKKLEAAMKNKD